MYEGHCNKSPYQLLFYYLLSILKNQADNIPFEDVMVQVNALQINFLEWIFASVIALENINETYENG